MAKAASVYYESYQYWPPRTWAEELGVRITPPWRLRDINVLSGLTVLEIIMVKQSFREAGRTLVYYQICCQFYVPGRWYILADQNGGIALVSRIGPGVDCP
jgi:hypothetical protein